MGWTAPPTRREFTLLLFCFTVYIVSYNLDSSLKLLGVNPGATQGVVLSRLGVSETKYIDKDGRKPDGWRDALEDEVFGKWAWDKGHISGDGAERSQSKGTTRHGAMWMSKQDIAAMSSKTLGETTVDQAVLWWQNNLPKTRLLKHVPGYTILDNVIAFNKTTYIITDDRSSFPELSSIVSPSSDFVQWRIITPEEGQTILGQFCGVIRGVTWMSTDYEPHNSTLFTLWRTYSSLDPSIDRVGRTVLPAPTRLILPNILFFTDPNPPYHEYKIRRRRADTGFHPYLAKAAFPHLGILYLQDWEDLYTMEVPFLVERLVVADRRAAKSSQDLNEPLFAPSMNLDASPYWWEPIRRTLGAYYNLREDVSSKDVVTYLHTQGEANGPRLGDEDNELLVRSLDNMVKANGYELKVVSTSTSETEWDAKMLAIARSTVVLGVHGDHLFDGMFMKRSSKSTLNVFPNATFVRDRELAIRSIGLQYIALSGDRKYNSDALPPVSLPSDGQITKIDVKAIVQAIRATLSSRS